MLPLSRTCLVLAAKGRLLGPSLKSPVHTFVRCTQRFSGKITDQPDPDQGKKFSSSDVRQSAGQGVPGPTENYIERNKKLNRPLSPHLTIFDIFQIPMMMSITHRVTGVLMGLGLGLTSLGILVSSHDFQHCVNVLHHMHLNEYLVYSVKLGAAWLLSYHYLNGIRHLLWDTGKGFQLPTLYRSGYVVLILSIVSAVYLASL